MRATPLTARMCFTFVLLSGLFGCSKSGNQKSEADKDVPQTAALKITAGVPSDRAGKEAVQEHTAAHARVKAEGQLGPGRGTLVIDLRPPEGATLTAGSPLRLSGSAKDITFPEKFDTRLDLKALPLRFPLEVTDGAQGPVELDLTYYYCTKSDHGSCRPLRQSLSVEIDLSGSSAGGEAHLVHRPEV